VLWLPYKSRVLSGGMPGLDLAVEADFLDGLRSKMNETIESYLDTEDKESIPRLLYRRAPLRDWLR
jgi:hypothetical protein